MTRFSDSSEAILSLSASKARSFGIAENSHDTSNFFAVWQALCAHLDAINLSWQVHFSEPLAVSDYITMRCVLEVGDITREATGSDKGCLIQVGKSTIGIHAPERAMLNAFCNAATQFGIVLSYAKKPPDTNHDLESVVTILRRIQRKQKLKRGFKSLAAVASLMIRKSA
ncbi:MAG: hypothetical protein NW214_04265 [Pseudanabaenaceae cyanobacterium bins.39]|nr:hypothetical protein [Pseudanabaenaceae cyanobacterium bins.39]